MLNVNMSSLWGNEKDKIIQGVLEATENLAEYRKSEFRSLDMFRDLYNDIWDICSFLDWKYICRKPEG